MSKIAETRNTIQGEWSHLLATWKEAQMLWKDDVAFQFGKRFISPWETEIPSLLSALETLEEELQFARRDLR